MTYSEYSSIIDTIDIIDDIKMESELSVIKSFLREYNKATIVMENCYDSSSFEIFQEAKTDKKSKKKEKDSESSKEDDSIMGTVKKYSANDKNKAISVIAFIPRIIAAICSKIAKLVKGSKFAQSFKKTDELNKEESLEYKERRVVALNKIFEGKCETYLDRTDGKIKFKKSIKSILNDLCWAIPATAALVAVLHEFNRWTSYDPTNIEKIAMRLEHICTHIKDTKPKDIWAVLKNGVGALGDLLNDANAALLALDAALVAAKHKTDKELCKLQMTNNPDPEKELKVAKWNKFAESLLKVSTTMTLIIGPITFFKKKAKEVTEAVDDFVDFKKWWSDLGDIKKMAVWDSIYVAIQTHCGNVLKDIDSHSFDDIYDAITNNQGSCYGNLFEKSNNKSKKEQLLENFIYYYLWAFNKTKISEDLLKLVKVTNSNSPYFSEEIIKQLNGKTYNTLTRSDRVAFQKFYNACHKEIAKSNSKEGREAFKAGLNSN